MSQKQASKRRWVGLVPMSVLLLGMLFSACGGTPAQSGPVEVSYTYPLFSPVKDLALVQSAMNAVLKPRYNITVKLNAIDNTDNTSYEQKTKLLFASGGNCDVIFTAPWINNFYVNVAQRNIIPLDTLLQTDAPKTYASLPTSAWNAAKVNGKIYGVINQQSWLRQNGITIRKDYADKYGLDLSKVKDFSDLTAFWAKVKTAEPDVTPISDGSIYSSFNLGYDIVDGTSIDQGILGIRYTDPSLKVINITNTPEFKQAIELNRQWYTAGYLPKESPGDQLAPGLQSGKYIAEIAIVNPDSTVSNASSYGHEWVGKGFGTPFLTTGGINATMNGICRTSAHPDADMKLLEALNTDKEVYRLLADGIEGKHYSVVDKDKGVIGFPAGITATNDAYNPNTGWMFGNGFNDFVRDPALVGVFDKEARNNATATPSVGLGFSFDPKNVKTEEAQISAAVTQYGVPLFQGQIDPVQGLAQFQQKLNEAGLDKLSAEVQRQLDAYKAAKK